MPRGKFIPEAGLVSGSAARNTDAKKAVGQIKLIKSEPLLPQEAPAPGPARQAAKAPPEEGSKHPSHFLFTPVLIALFVMVNIGLAVVMKGGGRETQTQAGAVPARPAPVSLQASSELPARKIPVTPATAPDQPPAARDADLLSIISKE